MRGRARARPDLVTIGRQTTYTTASMRGRARARPDSYQSSASERVSASFNEGAGTCPPGPLCAS